MLYMINKMVLLLLYAFNFQMTQKTLNILTWNGMIFSCKHEKPFKSLAFSKVTNTFVHILAFERLK